MARRPNITPTVALQVMLPKPDHEILVRHLWSDLEERVPLGAFQAFFVRLMRFHFDTQEFDLSPFIGSMPGESVIRVRRSDAERLRSLLCSAATVKEPQA